MAKSPIPVTVERLKEVLDYNPETGVFTWLKRTANCVHVGDIAGYEYEGYVRIEFEGSHYRAHRLAIFYVTGQWPEHEVDHKNTNRSDNRWVNLRPATHSQNQRNAGIRKNNSSGFKGVSWASDRKKWRACIKLGPRTQSLGQFNTAEEAARAHDDAARKYYGEFARTNFS